MKLNPLEHARTYHTLRTLPEQQQLDASAPRPRRKPLRDIHVMSGPGLRHPGVRRPGSQSRVQTLIARTWSMLQDRLNPLK